MLRALQHAVVFFCALVLSIACQFALLMRVAAHRWPQWTHIFQFMRLEHEFFVWLGSVSALLFGATMLPRQISHKAFCINRNYTPSVVAGFCCGAFWVSPFGITLNIPSSKL